MIWQMLAALQGTIDMAKDDWGIKAALNELPSQVVESAMRIAGRPVSERIYVGSVLNRKRPITEQDLNPTEQEMLQKVIETARSRRIEAGIPKEQQASFAKGNGTIKPADYVYASKDEGYKNPISNTIGTSHYSENADGSVEVKDNYDWKNGYDDWLRDKYKGLPLVDKIMKVLNASKLQGGQLLGQTTAENFAAAFTPDVSIPVDIRIPKGSK